MGIKPSPATVLIVGAGAMGLTLGYHLHLAGARIIFLVRPLRAPHLARPLILYSYDDATVKTFSEFEVITAPGAGRGLSPDYVISTLDGAATTSPEGTTLLRELGESIGGTAAVMIGGGVGVGLREHFLASAGLPSNRILMGVLGSFAYQVDRANLPLHPPTDAALLAKADIAYRHHSKSGFMLEGRFLGVAKRFAALYDGNKVARCAVWEPRLYEILTTMPFPIFAGSELLGWCPVTDLAKDKHLWRLTCNAVREIARLDRHGWRGKLAGLLLTDWTVSKMWSSLERASRPLDFQAFNAFHHGAKVATQDGEILQNCLAAGVAEGKPMKSLEELLLRRADARASFPDTSEPTGGQRDVPSRLWQSQRDRVPGVVQDSRASIP